MTEVPPQGASPDPTNAQQPSPWAPSAPGATSYPAPTGSAPSYPPPVGPPPGPSFPPPAGPSGLGGGSIGPGWPGAGAPSGGTGGGTGGGRGRRGFATMVLAGALVVGGGAGLAAAALYDTAGPGSTGAQGSTLQVVDNGDKAPATGSVESVAATVLPSVVALDVRGAGGAGTGSGVILDSDGLILTNNHVVTLGGEVAAQQAEVTVSFNDGKRVRASVVGTDPLTDTALVKVDGVAGLRPITIGKSANVDVGEQVVAIGSPFGLDSTVTSGIVSALKRPVEVAQDEQGNVTAYPAIQTDAAINPGNSGGALVNMDGQLVGINASIRSTGSSSSGGTSGSIGLGFAIPIDEILPIIDQLKAGEPATHARLGIQVSDAAGRSGSSDPTLVGARIEQITAGSAAAGAGLREGDVITRIDDTRIDDTEGLIATVRSYRPGDTVKVAYLRDGKEGTAELKLDSDG